MLTSTVPKKERPEEWIYNEKKIARQFMLTDTASAAIDQMAEELGISRSEVVERAARCDGMKKARRFDPQTGKCET